MADTPGDGIHNRAAEFVSKFEQGRLTPFSLVPP
jgi:hypothetical protein